MATRALEEPLFRELMDLTGPLSDQKDFKALHKLIGEIAVAGTPDLALVQTRRTLESIMEDVYKRRFQEPAKKGRLNETIEQLVKKGQLPELVAADATYVRVLANPRAHSPDADGSETPPDLVRASVGRLIPTVRWYIDARLSGWLDGPPVPREDKPAKAEAAEPRLEIVPKGLGSFDAGDAKFYLKLLPGPYHAGGLPESIHFWKHRIEKEATFTVGLIYGRSGCGKSSLLKAGLLPNLAANVRSVYIEATPDGTEATLLRALRKLLPDPSDGLDLEQAVEAVGRSLEESAAERSPQDKEEAQRRRAEAASGKRPPLDKVRKVLIVIDQFEQWMHARRGQAETELVRALRRCDGAHVQAMVSVRDDFWGDASEFMAEVEQGLKTDENSRMVDLFKKDHARRVLAAFGRAYKRLPDEPTPEQDRFLDQAIEGLSQGGKVVCVRLALFAQMFQEKDWTPKVLEEVGGTEGVGATFLEETFCAPSSDPKYSSHKDGAIAVLKKLLPGEGVEIKGSKCTYDELFRASGYKRPEDFAQLVRCLDTDLRLISPASKSASARDLPLEESADVGPAGRSYQLTHDYLVPSLRNWLGRKLQETRRGRASLLLARRSSHWKASKMDDRHMPTFREYLVIRTLTNPREWDDDERRMMQHARNVHARSMALAAVALPLVVLAGLNAWANQHSRDLVDTLTSAHIEGVPAAIDHLAPYRYWVEPLLREALRAESTSRGDADQVLRKRIHASLALLTFDSAQVDFLRDRLYDSDLHTFLTIRQRLSAHRQRLLEPLWRTLEDESAPAERRFRAACALAEFVKDEGPAAGSRWEKSAEFVASRMIDAIADDPGDFNVIVEALAPARRHLVAPLSAAFRNPEKAHQGLRANILARYAADQPETLAALVADARAPESFKKLYDALTSDGRRPTATLAEQIQKPVNPATVEPDAIRKANAAVALIKMGPDDMRPRELEQLDAAWALLKASDDPRVRSRLIDRIGSLRVSPGLVFDRLKGEPDDGIRQALILALGRLKGELKGEFDLVLVEPKRRELAALLEAAYRDSPDPGVRGAAEWSLRSWGRGDRLAEIDRALGQTDGARSHDVAARRWYVNGQGQTMVVIPRAGSFKVGSRRFDPPDFEGKREPERQVEVDYPFAIAAHEVTFAEFHRFRPGHVPEAHFHTTGGKPDPRCPVNNVSWYDAAAYCNWLSEQEGIPEGQWCYLPNRESKFADGMQLAGDHRSRVGYRLPTEVEWEYACRAGTFTSRYYGEADDLLGEYAWYNGNSGKQLWPVGSLMPNRLGLFDTLGNAIEWCQDAYRPGTTTAGLAWDPVVRDTDIRVMKGEKSLSEKENLRAARREVRKQAKGIDFIFGFRPARTLRP